MLYFRGIKSFVSDFDKVLVQGTPMDSNEFSNNLPGVRWGEQLTPQPPSVPPATSIAPPAPHAAPPPHVPEAPAPQNPAFLPSAPILPTIDSTMAPVAPQENTGDANSDSALIDIADENEGATLIGKLFYTASTGKAFLIGALLFTIIPLAFTLILSYFGGVFTSSDTDALPMVEDYASLSFFALGIFLPVMVLKMMNTIPLTVESLSNVLDLDTDSKSSTMTKVRLAELVNTYSYLYCKETGRNFDGVSMPKDEDLLKFIKSMALIKKLVIICCVGYTILTSYNRFIGVGGALVWHNYEASGFAYFSRTLTDFLLAAIMGPLVLYPIILCVMITYHSLKQVGDTNSLKFIRFSKDEAGGLGEYGAQSFYNTIALIPYSVVLVGIIIQARSLEIQLPITTMAATVVYLCLLLFVFFFPLGGAAKSMATLKKEELASLSKHYANSYLNFKIALEGNDDLNMIRLHSEAMIAAERVFDGIMKQPTVPYSKALITRLAGSLTPVFGGIATLFAF